MIRILFCDDDPAFVSSFLPAVKRQAQSVLELKDDELCCTYFQKGRELLDHLEKNEADLLFLDIDMPEMSGFELARALKSGKKKPTLVFVSAYDNFVYSAFEFSPFAYLRKERISEGIIHILSTQKLQQRACPLCRAALPWNWPYRLCDACYRREGGRPRGGRRG